ncbi:MAG: adenylate kinase [Rubritalea sp.]|jgi:adenylate kinase
MNSSEVIFLGGIHGVGKTTYCKKNYDDDYSHVTASQLIKMDGEALINENKKVANIAKNQEILVKAITAQLKINSKLVIDGHYCLVKENNQISIIDKEVFTDMRITKLVLLISDPTQISQRINKRDRNIWTVEFISDFQNKEVEQANFIATDLNIELLTVRV